MNVSRPRDASYRRPVSKIDSISITIGSARFRLFYAPEPAVLEIAHSLEDDAVLADKNDFNEVGDHEG